MEGISSFKQLEPNTLLNGVIEYVEKQLPYFVNSQTFKKVTVKKKNETQHTSAFCLFMMKDQDKYNFMSEVAQRDSRRIDIAIISKASDDIIFTIEAKILPTPPGTKKSPRAKSEYVFSNKGEAGAAMQRFRDGVHGLDFNETYLPENGIIAYVKDNDFDFWLKQINQWVLDASWSNSEKLEKVFFNTTAKLISKHNRDESSLILHHFWVKIS